MTATVIGRRIVRGEISRCGSGDTHSAPAAADDGKEVATDRIRRLPRNSLLSAAKRTKYRRSL